MGTSTVGLKVVALRSSGSSARCRARFPMMDCELCQAMGCDTYGCRPAGLGLAILSLGAVNSPASMPSTVSRCY